MIISQKDIKKVFNKPELYKIIEDISTVARQKSIRCFLVGGVVRDIIILKSRGDINIKSTNNDVDFVVEGDAKSFVELLLSKGLAQTARYYKRFNTSNVNIGNDCYIDIASARTEKYKSPGAQPDVDFSTIDKDLFRRDFTINSIALELCWDKEYKILDLYAGIDDIRNGVIRPIHDRSFIDDPSRILRAIRFSVRLGFSLDNTTLELIEQVLQNRIFKKIAPSRLYKELLNILQEDSWIECLVSMKNLNVIEPLPTPLDSCCSDFLDNIADEKKIKKINSSINSSKCDIIAVVRFSSLFRNLEEEQFFSIGESMFTTKKARIALRNCFKEIKTK